MNTGIVPRVAWLTVNRSCNFRCAWCYAKDTKYSEQSSASLDYALRVIGILRDVGVKRLLFIGGEPTLWKHLLAINKHCRDIDMETRIVTNAARFGNDVFWEKYQIYPNTHGGVSVKGYNPEHLLRIAGFKDFELARRGIERAVKLWKCGAGVVYNSLCADNIIDIAKFIMASGAASVDLTTCTPSFTHNLADSKYVIHPHDVVAGIVRDYERLNEITSGRISLYMKLPLCIWPREFLDTIIERKQIGTICQLQSRSGIIFDIDGNVLMCNGLFNQPIGKLDKDFSDADSLQTFLNNPEITGFYEAINSYPSQKCIDCPMYNMCGGGCPLFWSTYKPDDIITGLQ